MGCESGLVAFPGETYHPAMVHPDIVKWLTLQIADITERGGINRFELYHTVEESPAERIQVFDIGDGVDPQDLGQSIWDMAENDASSRALGVPQRYVIWSFRGEAQEMDSQWAFAIRGKTVLRGSMDLGESSDPPTERGIAGAVLRHNEALHRMVMLMTDATAGRLAAELQQERKRRAEVEDKMLDTMNLHQQLLDKKAERELYEARETAKARRHDELMGFFLSMAPLLASQFLGQKGFGADAGAAMRDTAIGKILKGLSPDEAMGVIGALKDQNRLAFMELYKSYAQEDAADQEKKPIPFRDPKAGKK